MLYSFCAASIVLGIDVFYCIQRSDEVMFVICGTASAVLLTFVFLMLMNVFAYLSKFENSINFEIMFQKNIPGGRGSKRF